MTAGAAGGARPQRLLAWVAGLGMAIVLLTIAGRGGLATPPLGASWIDWAAQRDAVVIAFALLRVATLGLAWYLLGVTIVGAAARMASWRGLVRVSDTLTIPSVRRLLQSALGAGLATAAITAGSAGMTGPQPPDTPAAVLTATQDPAGDSEVMVPVGQATEVMLPFEPEPREERRRTWKVRSGDHFWSIAATVLEESWGRAPADDEVAVYWQKLVERNRSRLADKGNADLIVPGQVFELPKPPARPAR